MDLTLPRYTSGLPWIVLAGSSFPLRRLPVALISAVNLAEAVTRAVDRGQLLADARAALSSLPVEVVPFDVDQAYLTSALRPWTRPFGLSLGDRACLALASSRRLPAITADRSWADVDVGVTVEFIR